MVLVVMVALTTRVGIVVVAFLSGPCYDQPHFALPVCPAVHAPLCQSGGRTAVQLLLRASKKM